MKKLLVILSLLLTAQAFATSTTRQPGIPMPKDVAAQLNLSAVHAPTVALGDQVTTKKLNVLKAVYDFAKLGGASGTSVILRDASGGNAMLPPKAIVKDVIIDVLTALAGTGAKVTIGLQTSNDLKTEVPASFYTVAINRATLNGSSGLYTKIGGARVAPTISFTGTAEGSSVTAGKFNMFIEYYLSD